MPRFTQERAPAADRLLTAMRETEEMLIKKGLRARAREWSDAIRMAEDILLEDPDGVDIDTENGKLHEEPRRIR